MSQLGLFGDDALPTVAADPACLDAHRRLAAHVPPGVAFGTSSWSFPGWRGLVWHGKHDAATLSRDGLAAYASLPLFGAVGLDSTYYARPDVERLQRWAEQVPERFRFVVKAWDLLTATHLDGRRHGGEHNAPNPSLLDPAFARDHVVAPLVEGLGGRLHAVVLQFTPGPSSRFGGPEAFARRVADVAAACVGGPPLVAEPRTPGLLTEAWREVTRGPGLTHCASLHAAMPDLHAQRPWIDGAAGPLVVRWMLQRGRSYAEAKESFAPFDRLAAPDPSTRHDVAELVLEAAAARPVTVIVNNKAEGSSPASITALADALAGAR